MRALAEAGYAPAQAEFGSLYFGGRGVSQDFETAYRWFALAASRIETARERDMALSNRDLAAQRLSPDQIARAEDWVKAWRPR